MALNYIFTCLYTRTIGRTRVNLQVIGASSRVIIFFLGWTSHQFLTADVCPVYTVSHDLPASTVQN